VYANKIIKNIILTIGLGLTMGFTGCSEKQIEVLTIPDERQKLNLSEPEPLKLKPVNFYVITEKNKEQIFKQLQAQNKDLVLIGLTDDDYIKMSENMILIQNYIINQRFLITSYKTYYESDGSTDLVNP
jgi:hypothetical protein